MVPTSQISGYTVPGTETTLQPQKVDINRAEKLAAGGDTGYRRSISRTNYRIPGSERTVSEY